MLRLMFSVHGPEPLAPLADHNRFRFVVLSSEGVTEAHVEISGTAMCCSPEELPSPIGEAVLSRGRSVVERMLASGAEIAPRIVVRTESICPPI